ncbi:MAG: alpha/beta fold hydrolase [Pseudomonadota bacterium]
MNDVSLFFDVEGAGLVPDGPAMREKPTLILLHGGPGADHSLFKPRWSGLSDIAQIIYLDHRGNGRSEDGDPADWTLAQWGDDVRGLCDALGIERPIVCGVSFGGFVAQSYATRHADHIGGLILISTAAKFDFDAMLDAFEAKGGAEAREAAANYWLNPTAESRARYGEICFPLYYQGEVDADAMARLIFKNPPALHFNGLRNEQGRMDFRAALADFRAPTLILAGDDDPITPPAFTAAIHRALPEGVARYMTYENCGHGVMEDRPDAMNDVRAFIADTAGRIL